MKNFQTKLALEINCRSSIQGPGGKVLHSVPSSASLYGTDVVVEEQRQLVDCVARHIVYGNFLKFVFLVRNNCYCGIIFKMF